jgi:hypothetical protein
VGVVGEGPVGTTKELGADALVAGAGAVGLVVAPPLGDSPAPPELLTEEDEVVAALPLRRVLVDLV